MSQTFKTFDIHSYILFANVNNREGTIAGHRVILTQEQTDAIEQIVLSADVKLHEEVSYEVEDANR